jgi:hypothetical protein
MDSHRVKSLLRLVVQNYLEEWNDRGVPRTWRTQSAGHEWGMAFGQTSRGFAKLRVLVWGLAKAPDPKPTSCSIDIFVRNRMVVPLMKATALVIRVPGRKFTGLQGRRTRGQGR